MTRSPNAGSVAASPSEHRKAIARQIDQVSHSHSRWEIFSDFVELSAISISNAVDLVERDSRELRYLEIVKRYAPDEVAAFPKMLSELILALECGFDDVLGRLFHDLELHNRFQGQFFTPYELCRLMAKMTLRNGPSISETIADRGHVTTLEPACGGGAMVIALAEALKDEGVNYQHHLHATAVDVDLKCVHMAYIQLALLHVPAVVIHGNSLSLEEHSRWRTPAHVLGVWDWRLKSAEQSAVEPSKAEVDSTFEAPAPALGATCESRNDSLAEQMAFLMEGAA